MRTRQHIGIAVGIVMQRYGLDQDRAFQYLARVSQSSNIKLREVAEEVINHAGQEHPAPSSSLHA